MNKFLFSPHKQGAQMTRVTHRVTQLHHQHTQPGGSAEIWLHTRHLNKQYNYLRSTHLSPHSTTIGWREELCICHLLLRTIKQNQIGVLWGKQSLPPPSQHVSMLRLLTQIVPGDLYIVDLWFNASDECTSARNRYATLPSCKGEPPRQILGRIPPHTHLQVCHVYVKPPT